MTSLFENLKMKGGGNRNPGCPNVVHFKLHKISKGRSQKHSFFGLNLLTLPSCNCEFDLWCEYPALTKITDNGISIVDTTDIKNYIANIITFVKNFKTKNIVMRLQAPKIQLDWTIQHRARMYEMLAGVNATSADAPGLGGSLTGPSKERTFPFYSLENSDDSSTIGYLITELKKNNPEIKIYLLPSVSFSSGSTGPLPFVTALSPSTPIPGYSASSSDNQNAVDSFWCAVHFYKWYNTYSKVKIGHGFDGFDGVIIETEGLPLNSKPPSHPDGVTVPGLSSPNAQVRATYSLFNTPPSASLQSIPYPVLNYKSTPPLANDIDFGLTGSPTLSKTQNQINKVTLPGTTLTLSKINKIWPQYYNLMGTTSEEATLKKATGKDVEYDASVSHPDAGGPPPFTQYSSAKIKETTDEIYDYSKSSNSKVQTWLQHMANWDNDDNDTDAEVIGMLSIETPQKRKYNSTSINYNEPRQAFFGSGKWTWSNICNIGKEIGKRKLKSRKNLRVGIFTGDLLSAFHTATSGPPTSADSSINKLSDTDFKITC